METRILTGTGITVSRMCLGAMTFGGQVNEADSIKITDYAFNNGVNFIDTANTYNSGISEMIVGKAIKPFREKIILATKCGYGTIVNDDYDWAKPNVSPNEQNLSRKNIIRAVDESLKRLDTDYIDIMYFHRPIYHNTIDESLDTMYNIIRSGKVRYFGVCNHASWQICEEIWYSRTHNGFPPVVAQNLYNVITRSADGELVPFLKEYKTGFVVFNPIAGGLLSGKHKFENPEKDSRFDSNKYYQDRYWNKENFEAIESLSEIASKSNMSLLELSIRWVASQDHVDSILMGMSKLDQLKENISLLHKGKLEQSILDECDKVWLRLRGNHAKHNRGPRDM